MKAHLGDMLRPAIQEGAGENIFEDGSEQFISGDFAADLNEDFLGLRDLGLDKELGLSSLSVPLHLLTSRITNMQNQTAGPAASVDGYTQPPPFEPITAEVLAQQIDIVKPYFEEKLAGLPAEGAAIEDEELPPRQRPNKPRLPPTGKITQSRKRVAGAQGGNSKKKKKPNPIEDKKAVPTKKERDESFGKGTEMDEGGMISPESIAA
jgi:transcriptional activator SPT7